MKKICIIIIAICCISCSEYKYEFAESEVHNYESLEFIGDTVDNALTWTLWEMESVEGFQGGYPEYEAFYLYYENSVCSYIYKESGRKYFYRITRECVVVDDGEMNYLHGGGYFVGTKTFVVHNDEMVLFIDRGPNRITRFNFSKIDFIDIEVVESTGSGE